MELILKRIAKKPGYTIGKLSIKERVDDEYLAGESTVYFCDTLEPPALEKKTSVAKAVILRSKKKAQALKPFAIPEGPEGGHGTELQRLGGTIEKEDRGSQRQG